MFMLDMNICIFLIKNKHEKLIARVIRHDPKDIVISSITVAELEYGIQKSAYYEKNKIALIKFLFPFAALPFDTNAAGLYGSVRALLEKRGLPIGPMDLLIAAHAASLKATLVTNNTREFARVPGLKVENWI